eukprot:s2358_g4.t1
MPSTVCSSQFGNFAVSLVKDLDSFLRRWNAVMYTKQNYVGTDAGEIWLKEHPEASRELLELLSEVIIEYLSAQARAGCKVLQVFEAMGEHISPDNFNSFALPAMRRIAEGLKERHPEVPLMVFPRGACYALTDLQTAGYDVVTVDTATDLAEASSQLKAEAAKTGGRVANLQGNFDPKWLRPSEGSTEEDVRSQHDDIHQFHCQRSLGSKPLVFPVVAPALQDQSMRVNPSDIYPAVKRFLTESGLNKTLKVFEKETAALEDLPVVKPKKAKALQPLELVAACQAWLEVNAAAAGGETTSAPTNGAAEEAPRANKKRKREAAEEAPAEEEPTESTAVEAAWAASDAAEGAEGSNKKSKKQEKEEKAQEKKDKGTPFKRVEDDKWRATIKDDRLLDNTHKSKVKYGNSDGDTWADQASEDLLKVKGKGFRKEMAKKKRASWRGELQRVARNLPGV